MNIINIGLLLLGKFINKFSLSFNLGSGSTWPGHIALKLQKDYIKNVLSKSPTDTILIVGTNGKTTTSRILSTILEKDGKKVFQNNSGANLLNGIASTILLNTSLQNKLTAEYGVFEVDENSLPLVLKELTPKVILVLNLFRDQLDRYGELDTIAKKWHAAFKNLGPTTTLVLNSDDPLVAYLAKDISANVLYFGLDHTKKEQKNLEHAADSIYCPQCSTKLVYSKIFYSHLGVWRCPNCHVKRPLPRLTQSFYPLPGAYNEYNTLAAVLTAKQLGVKDETIEVALHKVTPAFGRQEKIYKDGKYIQLFLSKNPTSFNESLRTVMELGAKTVLLVLNDQIPDGRDVSWIWDVDTEHFLESFKNILVSGDRTYDMALRIAYSNPSNPETEKLIAEPNLSVAIQRSLAKISPNETLFILPTYSAMLDVRKLLTGKKIL